MKLPSWETLASISTFASSLIAVAAWWVAHQTIKDARLYNAMNLASTLANRFEDMKLQRKEFATALFTELQKPKPNVERMIPTTCAILEFFEDLGYFTRRGLVDKGIVWNHFFWIIERYHFALTEFPPNKINFLEELRRIENNDPTFYQEFEWLFETLKQEEVREREMRYKAQGRNNTTVTYRKPSYQRVLTFLKEESNLIV